MIHPAPMTPAPSDSKLVTPSATLPLEGTTLRLEASGGIARVVLEQRFKNKHPDPLAVTYTFALPADAAVSGFAFAIGDRRIEGEVEKRRVARERFEQAIAEGKTAALLEQERSSLFTQELGNVPPGAEVRCEIAIDQRLRFIDEGSWEWRFPLASAPRYLGGPGRVEDAAEIALDVAEALAPRAALHMTIADALAQGRTPESPSHPVVVEGGRVELGDGGTAALDRDVVVRWRVAALEPSVTRSSRAQRQTRGRARAAHDRPAAARGPRTIGRARSDRAARHLRARCRARRSSRHAAWRWRSSTAFAIGTRLELIEFSSAPRRFRKAALPATEDSKQAALDWLAKLRASRQHRDARRRARGARAAAPGSPAPGRAHHRRPDRLRAGDRAGDPGEAPARLAACTPSASARRSIARSRGLPRAPAAAWRS